MFDCELAADRVSYQFTCHRFKLLKFDCFTPGHLSKAVAIRKRDFDTESLASFSGEPEERKSDDKHRNEHSAELRGAKRGFRSERDTREDFPKEKMVQNKRLKQQKIVVVPQLERNDPDAHDHYESTTEGREVLTFDAGGDGGDGGGGSVDNGDLGARNVLTHLSIPSDSKHYVS
ncbi:unnamed protein product [Angiostrongylus costaricensis]|uniref:Uncharacterized protein n=1 Tax=Angiostrongylus costaricensis TaxID=334426 RepID=A0A0R3PYV1_ANGCS|nr:unnamed protein product [Angiostrongylus costaricensis]